MEISDTITTTPDKKISLKIYENGEYWIDAKIKINGNTSDAFNTIKVTSLSEKIEKIRIKKHTRKTNYINSFNNCNCWNCGIN